MEFVTEEQFRELMIKYETPSAMKLRAYLSSIERDHPTDDVRCVVVLQNGSVYPSIHRESDNRSDLREGRVSIANVPYLVVWNKEARGKKNVVASKLLGIEPGMELRGPVTFVMLDLDYRPTHMSGITFKRYAVGASS